MKPAFFLIVGTLGLYFLLKPAPKVAAPAVSFALDSGIDTDTAQAVQTALTTGTNPQDLTTFATKLQAAGYPNSAAALRAKSLTLRPVI